MKFDFKNNEGLLLSGNLELPKGKPKAFAIFAHCFTCSKNLSVTSTIARSLAQKGIATLRFDFTGLGNSDGDFSNTNFSSNVEDLLNAYTALEEKYETPSILIGHSLGGAAVLKASILLDKIKAVVTIGAPSCTGHVSHLFSNNLDEINSAGEAEVNLAGRSFKIKKQLIDDLNESNILEGLSKQKKAYLIMHSPIDETVSVDHAVKIYKALKHPKSYISLDQADHLLTKRIDSKYVAEMIYSWLGRYIPHSDDIEAPKRSVKEGELLTVARSQNKFTQDIYTTDHQTIVDEPLSYKGDNLGLTPYQMLLAGLGACTSMTMKMYAQRKNIPLQGVEVILKHSKEHVKDCEECEESETKLDVITKSIKLTGDLTSEQRQKLLDISEKCPVNKTLKSQVVVKMTEDS